MKSESKGIETDKARAGLERGTPVGSEWLSAPLPENKEDIVLVIEGREGMGMWNNR